MAPKYATYYGSKIAPDLVQLGKPDRYGVKTYVEPYDPRLLAFIRTAEEKAAYWAAVHARQHGKQA